MMPDRREIVLMVGSLRGDLIGGMQVQVEGTAGELAKVFDVVVLARAFPGSHRSEARQGYRIVRKAVGPVPGVRWVVDLASTLRLLARRKDRIAGIVAYQTLGTGLVGVLAGRILGIPCLVSVRNESEYGADAAGLALRALSRITWGLASRILVQSGRVRDAFLRSSATAGLRGQRTRDRVAVVPNGIALPTTRAPDRSDRVVYVGRLHPSKGLDHLVDALGGLAAKHRPELLLIGDGPMRDALIIRARQHDVSSRVTGRVSAESVRDFLGRGGIFVLPSLAEGMSNALLEAMSFGLPVVATSVGSTPDVIVDGENGLLVPPGDADALRDAIHRLQTDARLRSRLASGAADTAAEYSWTTHRQRFVEQLRLAGAGPSRSGRTPI
jgi:glycosyltransferase involved in cell wall biosynthesis